MQRLGVNEMTKSAPSRPHNAAKTCWIQADLAAPTQCSLADLTNLWVSVLPESSLFVPLQQAFVDTSNIQALSVYPYPFTNLPTLSNTAFILPKNDPASWAAASQIAYGLGNQANGAIFDLSAAYDGAVPDELRSQHDLVVVGLPSELTILSDLKDALPAPFEKGQNNPVVKNLQVNYRFAPDTSLGYLELLAAPWNQSGSILAVLGSNPAGIQMAASALTDPTLQTHLSGNFALVNGANISTMDTRTGIGLGGIAANPVATTQPAAAATTLPVLPSTPIDVARPTWILPAVGVLAVLTVGVLILALVSGRRKTARN